MGELSASRVGRKPRMPNDCNELLPKRPYGTIVGAARS
jgi:hypothetical protein